MEVVSQQTQDQGGASWEQYADCKNMTQFGDLRSPAKNHHQSIKSEVQNPDKKKHKKRQDSANLPSTDKASPKVCRPPTTSACTGSLDLVLSYSWTEPRSSFGNPSPLRYDPQTSHWVRGDAEVIDTTPRLERSIDDLYLENPEKKLQATIQPSTMNLAASVVLHVASESGYQWFDKWCPHMNLREVFEAISVEGTGSKLASKRYNVPREAIGTSHLTTTLADMYRTCRDVHPKGSGDSEYSIT
jgi:hypothetical protein